MQTEKTTAQKSKGIKAALSEIQKRNTGREKTFRRRTAIDSGKEKIPAYDRHRKEARAEMIAAPGKGGIHADDRVGNGGISGQSKKPEKCKSRVRQQCRKRRYRNDSRAVRAKIRSNDNAENTNTGRIEKQQKRRGRQFCLPRLLAAGCGCTGGELTCLRRREE